MIYWRIHGSKPSHFSTLCHSYPRSWFRILWPSLWIWHPWFLAISKNCVFFLIYLILSFNWGTKSSLEVYFSSMSYMSSALSGKREYYYTVVYINRDLFTGIQITKIKQYSHGIGNQNCVLQIWSINGRISRQYNLIKKPTSKSRPNPLPFLIHYWIIKFNLWGLGGE